MLAGFERCKIWWTWVKLLGVHLANHPANNHEFSFPSSGAMLISLGCITASLSHNLRRGSGLVCVSLKNLRNPPSAISLSWISFGWKEDITSLSYYFSLIRFNITAWMLSSECSSSLSKANVLCFQHLSLSANVLPFFLHSANGTLYASAYILWSTLSRLILWASESDLETPE